MSNTKMSNLFGDSDDEEGQINTPPESKYDDIESDENEDDRNSDDKTNGRKDSLSDGEIVESETEINNIVNNTKTNRENKDRYKNDSDSDIGQEYRKRDRDKDKKKRRKDEHSDEDLFETRDYKHSHRDKDSRHKKDKLKDRHRDKHKYKKHDSERSRDRSERKRRYDDSDKEFDEEIKRRKDDKERFSKNGTPNKSFSDIEDQSLTPELRQRQSITPEPQRKGSLTPEYRYFEESLKNIEENAIKEREKSQERIGQTVETVDEDKVPIKENDEKITEEAEPYDPEEDLEIPNILAKKIDKTVPKPVAPPKHAETSKENGSSNSKNGNIFESLKKKSGRKMGKTEIGTLVVKLMTPAYVERRFESRDLFKALARQISHAVVDKDEREIKEYVENFLKKNSEITSKTTI